jgi:hypothetical protein
MFNSGISPRRGAFEITIKNSGKEHLIWTGLKKGPPRKEKFPAVENIIENIKSFL